MFPKTRPSSSSLLGRRAVLRAGGLLLAGLGVPDGLRPARASGVVEIRLRSDTLGTKVWFDPIGLLIEPGQTVRWVNESNVHTSTAYHPANDGHALRIPRAAAPWDSGYLVEPGDRFEVALTVPGVYDYFCAPHEAAGMVGRIIVGEPSGPGALAFDYFQGDPAAQAWRAIPKTAQAAFPAVELIMSERVVRGCVTLAASPPLPCAGRSRPSGRRARRSSASSGSRGWQPGGGAHIRSRPLDLDQFLWRRSLVWYAIWRMERARLPELGTPAGPAGDGRTPSACAHGWHASAI